MYLVVDLLESEEYGFGRLDGVLLVRGADVGGDGVAGTMRAVQFRVVEQNFGDVVRRLVGGDDLEVRPILNELGARHRARAALDASKGRVPQLLRWMNVLPVDEVRKRSPKVDVHFREAGLRSVQAMHTILTRMV